MPRHRVPKFTKCCICGGNIFPQSIIRGKGYCLSCKNMIMEKWSSIPFEEREKYLRCTGRFE